MNKEFEQRCFDLTREYISSRVNKTTQKYINSVIPICTDSFKPLSSERPDFIAGFEKCTYLIEHFLIDTCNDGPNNNQSESRLSSREFSCIFKRYHDPEIGTIKDEDIPKAIAEIQKATNRMLNISMSFDYKKYVDAFRRIFNHHYGQIDNYLNNPNISNSNVRIGFMIEFHCDTTLLCATKDNSILVFNEENKAFPLTKEIANLFESATKLDFIIVSQFNEGVSIDAAMVNIYEPRNMRKSLEIQEITVYDEVFYHKIRKNITINLGNEGESS